jgi:hypothetical protein
MKVFVQDTQRWIIERAKGTDAITTHELAYAMQVMPNGFSVMAIQNRDDGTTILHLQSNSRRQVALPK